MEPCPHCRQTPFRDDFARKRHVAGCRENPKMARRRAMIVAEEARQAEEARRHQETFREMMRGTRPMFVLQGTWGTRLEVYFSMAPDRRSTVRIDGRSVPFLQNGGCGGPNRDLELPESVVEELLKGASVPIPAGADGGWEFRTVAYWTPRESQTLVITFPRDLTYVEIRYDFEDLA